MTTCLLHPIRRALTTARLLAALLFCLLAYGSPVAAHFNPRQTLDFAGLRTTAGKGQINAVQSDAAGNLYFLLSQGDGVRVFKVDPTATSVLAQAQLGAAGDTGVALALDASANVYLTGTTSSSSLAATPGAAIPTRSGASTNSFVAKFDPSLNLLFLTFTGGTRIAATALAVNSSSVFVTGLTYSTDLPVTSNGIQQTPALGSTQNGFVERFSADGATLLYATYLTGADGDTTPTAIAATPLDDALIAGSTSAPGFPTVAALIPESLSTPSGFLTHLSPAGDAIVASTFIPGAGLTSLVLDASTGNLLASGSVSLGQFPVDTAAIPLLNQATYQVLLRLPQDLSSVQSATVLAPGTQSFLASAPDGSVWVDGSLTLPLLPLTPLASFGNAFAVRVTANSSIDQTARFGGLPTTNPSYASLPAILTSIATDPTGRALIVGAIQPTASSTLLATQTYDLPLQSSPTPAFPSTLHDALPTTCNGSLCPGSAADLARVNPTLSVAALSLSADASPVLTLRNLGSASADSLQLLPSTGTLTSTCPQSLAPASECQILLFGGSAGTLTAIAANASPQSVDFPAFSPPASTIIVSPRELDFGIQTSVSPPATRTLTIANLGTTTQTFTSVLDAYSSSKLPGTSPFSEFASDCTLASAPNSKTLSPGGICHITLALTASSSASDDALLQQNWSNASQDVLLTGATRAAPLSVSSPTLDFGTQFTNGIHLPRYLFLSNPSTATISHTPVTLPTPFTLTDACPTTLLPSSICRIRVDYLAPAATSTDSATLTLDQGLTVLISGRTLPAKTVGGATVNPNLSVTPTAVTFATPVVVTGVSATTQTVAVTNSGNTPFTLNLALTGDFISTSSCPATLPAGQTCAVVVAFTPSQTGTREGLLAITAGPGTSPAYVALTGTATPLVPVTNATIALGSTPVSQPVTQYLKVARPFTSLGASTSGPYTVSILEDTGSGPTPPPASAFMTTARQACHNCYLAVRFQPTAVGPQPGTLTLTTDPSGQPLVLTLTGTGLTLTGLLLTPTAQDFGSIPTHSRSGTITFTLTNLSGSGAPVNVTPILSGTGFLLDSTPTGSPACGGLLAYTASCTLGVAFGPDAPGSSTGTLTFTAGELSASAALTATATPDPGLAITPLALTFNNSPGPTATTQTITLSNTGAAPLQVATPISPSSAFVLSSSCNTLAPAASCTITVTFQPGTAPVNSTLAIPVTSTQLTTYTIPLAGTYTASSSGLAILPALTEFGPQATTTQSTPRLFTVRNYTAKQVSLTVNLPRQYVLVGPACTTLAPESSCSFSIAFLPLTSGDISGTLTAIGSPSDGTASTQAIAYAEGFGVGPATLNLSGGLIINGAFDFGQVALGQSLPHSFTLTNPGPLPATIRRTTSGPPFLASTNCIASLPAGQSCLVTVSYTPAAASATSTADAGTLTIESDSSSSPQLLHLAGQPGPGGTTSTPPLATYTLSQNSLTFPSTRVGDASPPQSVTLTNTGSVALHLTSFIAPADFSVQAACPTVLPAASCIFSVSSTPQSVGDQPAGTHAASLEILSDSSTTLEFLSLLSTATPSTLTLTPTTLSFGSVTVGTSATLPLQVTNSGSAPITFSSIAATAGYTTGGSCSGTSLAPGAVCTIQVTFTPVLSGPQPGTLSVASSATTLPLTIPLAGTGTQSRLVITPAALSFGSIVVSAAANLNLTLQNTGTAPVIGLTLAAAGDYTVTIPCPATTLAPGDTCTAQVTFTPTAAGSRPATLTVTSSDPTAPVAVPLTGTGVNPVGSFTLTVDNPTVIVTSGAPATFHLTLAPTGGFAGTIALTCAPVVAAPYASCSLLPGSITLSGSAQPATATINTITSSNGNAALHVPTLHSLAPTLVCLLCPGLLTLFRMRRQRRSFTKLFAMFLAILTLAASGCGGGNASTLRYTPAGTYRYTVTAVSTSGTRITQSVTLNLSVKSR